jgi:carotenoid 1,2-hydratase
VADRRQRPPGTGPADGGDVGLAGGAGDSGHATTFPDFDRPVGRDGYAWWYLDAVSNDGRDALVVIAFVGSVFSPYYARARRTAGPAGANPLCHCAVNVALYRDRRPLWTMTERGADALARAASQLQIGRSTMRWRDDALEVGIDEWSVPLPQRVRGRVRLVPRTTTGPPMMLDRAGRHQWWPIAPLADVEIDFDQPAWRWRGCGYLDSNRGSEPLERAFAQWHWARVHLDDGSCGVVYDTVEREGNGRGDRPVPGRGDVDADARGRNGMTTSMALRLRDGRAPGTLPPLAMHDLPRGTWGVARRMRADHGSAPRVLRSLEDGPFYTRSLVESRWHGRTVVAVHESLDLDRFVRPAVQAMLPFRMPRRG